MNRVETKKHIRTLTTHSASKERENLIQGASSEASIGLHGDQCFLVVVEQLSSGGEEPLYIPVRYRSHHELPVPLSLSNDTFV